MSLREGNAAEKSLTISTRLQICHMHHVPNIDCPLQVPVRSLR